MLATLIFTYIVSGSVEQLSKTRSIYVENVYADTTVSKTMAEVNKLDSSTLRAEYQGGEETQIPEVEDKIRQTFPEQSDLMLKIAFWESRLDPNATNLNRNGSKDCGLMQVNSIHGYDCEWPKDVDNNLRVARKIYDTQGVTAWSSYNNALDKGII